MANFTKNAIKASCLKLLNERPINKITVKDIVEDCGINRNSFYYHFQDIPSLLEDIITSEADAVIADCGSVESLNEVFEKALSFALKNKKAVLHIYNSANRAMYENYLRRICEHIVSSFMETAFPEANVSDGDKAVILRFYKCACMGFVLDWLESGMKEEVSAEIDRFCRLARGSLEEMISRSDPKE